MDNSKDSMYQFIEIQKVRICPPCIHFTEGLLRKKLKSKFSMQNVGTTNVFIRVCEPKIKNYVVDCFPRGKCLSPGLKIINRVKVEHTSETPNECLLPIYINDERHEYVIMIKPKPASFIITPEYLDFGMVNAGTIHNAITIILENKGPRDQLFQVDVGRCDECIVVEPLKGLLKGHGASTVNVRVMSFTEKVVDTMIFVKCAHKVTVVPIKARIILSRLEAIHANAAEHFTLLEFPPTYFGLKSMVNLFVRNFSAAVQMFSTTGEVHQKRDNLVKLKKNSINFKFFSVYPSDGMFQEDETKLFQFTFAPREIDTFTKHIQFYFCTIVIHRFHCGSLNIEGNFFASDSTVSLNTVMDEEKFCHFKSKTSLDFLRIHLYATAEVALVTVVPQEIVLRGLVLYECEIRIIEVTNKSEKLPIYLRYKKVPFVNLEQEKILLQPSESLQLAVNIVPRKLGNVVTEIAFHLMFYDYPKLNSSLKVIGKVTVSLRFDVIAQTQYPRHQINFGLAPNYIKEVGKHCQGVKFNTKIQKAKAITVNNVTQIDANCSSLVAFPNDTQQSMRPWRSMDAYKTIFTRTGRYVAPLQTQYELNIFDCSFKKEVNNYYTNYLRSQMRKAMPQIPSNSQKEYYVTKQGTILCTDLRCSQPLPIKFRQIQKEDCFIPLTPQEMDNITIYPPIVQTKEIATNSTYIFKIFVQNKNNYAIRLILTTDRPNLLYIGGNRHTISGKECYSAKIAYQASYIGYYTSNLYVIINESTVLSIPIFAQVVHKQLHLNKHWISFSNEETHTYLEMENKLNVPITFTWVVLNSNFTIEPCSGCVPDGRRINCIVRFHCNIDGPSETEAQLYLGDGHAHRINLSSNIVHHNLSLINDEVDFGYIPLNESVTNLLLIRNNDNLPLKYCIDDSDIPSGLKIYPMTGVLPASCHFVLYITAKFANCVRFNYSMKIKGLKSEWLEIIIMGTVVYPDIIIGPSYINVPKITASMTASMKFTLTNISVAPAKVSFDMEEYDEFAISETEYFCDTLLTQLVIPSRGVKTLYIHFFPAGASSCLFYLPIIINGILGPPLYSDVISTKVNYYLTEDCGYCEYMKIPTTVPCVKVRTLVTPEKIFISKKFIDFVVNGCEIIREQEFTLVICNTHTLPDDICLRIEQVKHPIYINYKAGNEIKRSECAIVFSLEPNEKTVFTISFQPDKLEFGHYRAIMPIYLRSDMSVEEHRIILIEAVYHKPIIKSTFDENLSAFERIRYNEDYVQVIEPMPFFQSNKLDVIQELRFINHLPNCEIGEMELKDCTVHVIPNSKTVVSENEYTVFVLIKTNLRVPWAYRIKWRLECSCGGSWEKHVNGVIEDSFLTTYATATLFKDWPNHPQYESKIYYYPFYPSPVDDNYMYMNECMSAARDWLRSQIFFGQWNYEIPATINFADFDPPTPECVRRQTQFSRIPIVHVLSNILGPQIIPYFNLQDTPNEEENKVVYLYLIYAKMIKLLEQQGTYIGYLIPEYLFSFKYFTYYKEFLYEGCGPPYNHTEFITEFEEFDRLSKQSWVDVILQIYKSLYLEKLISKHEKLCKSGRLSSTPISEYFVQELPSKCEFFLSQTESKILNWLEFHYNNHKHNTWPNGEQLEDVDVGLFNNSLNDGIVFAVVLVTYCPYLKQSIKDFYLNPDSPEQVFHNITKLIKCMEIIQYTFTIAPEQIIEGNPLRLLMFSAYLFEVLPFMYPTETMKLIAGLSINSTSKIEIFNENDFPIAYKPIFIGHCSDMFSANKVLYEIEPKKKHRISITYWARFAREVECTLILSGEVTGYRYVTNKCISLIGIPELDYATTTITYPQEIFLAKKIDFDVQSPYKVAAIYDMQQTCETIHEPLELGSVIYHFERNRIACARLVATNKCFDFDENGQCKINAVIGTTTMSTIVMWLYFRNDEVGDFAIKFISVIKDSTRNETLTVELPKYIEQLRERPDTLFLKIPNRNNLFFNSMKNLLVNLTEGEEADLWKRILDTPIGVNILENLFSTSDPKSRLGTPIRCKSAEYTVVVEKGADVILPEIIVFDNECSSGFAKTSLVLKNVDHYPRNFTFTMESKATQRKRYYYVAFTFHE